MRRTRVPGTPVRGSQVRCAREPGARNSGTRSRTRVRGALLLVVAAAVTACTGGSPAASTPAASTPDGPAASGSAATGRLGVTDPATTLITAAFDALSATAGGPVRTQQRLLSSMVAPGQQAGQRACPAVTTTLAFEPVYADLAAAPGWHPTEGTMPGTVYSLPTLIRIFTGDRLTGTDLADLHVSIDRGRVLLSTLCVG